MNQDQVDLLKRALKREKSARKAAEKILEDKSRELYFLSQDLQQANSKLENLLDEKSSQLQGVFENINDAYIVINLNGKILKMNDVAEELFGVKDYDNWSILNSLVEKDYDNALSSFKLLIETGHINDFKARIIDKQGSIKWVQVNGSIIYDKDKNPIAAQGIVRDITDQLEKSRLIKEQKDQLDIIVENSPYGIVLSLNGEIMKSNKSFQELLGYSEEELKLLKTSDITHPSDRLPSKTLSAKLNSGKTNNFTIEKKYIKKDGSIIWAKTTVNAVRDEYGEIKYQLALIEDRTKERENELMLQVINDVAKAILGKVDTAEIAWEIVNEIAEYLGTEDCVIYLLNEKEQNLEQIAAYGKKSKSKQVIDKIVLPLGKGIVGHVAKTGNAEIIFDTTKDKRYIVDDDQRLSEITVPIISGGNVIGIIDSESRDKNYFNENHLKTLTNIARLVSMQLANAINQEQKLKAEKDNIQLLKALESSNIELQEYAHVVSHDLKSPLRSIDALVSWIKEDNIDKLDDSSLKNIDLIESTLEHMEQLISDVLDYSSVTSENLADEIIDLNDVVEEVIKNIHAPKRIKIEVLNKLPKVKGDKTRFKQLFQNLISNAIIHNDKPEGFVNISYNNNKTHHKFSIEDNGIGIEKKYFDKIFEMFQSLHVSKESTGVGLSIVKKIINLYNGDIWIESELDKGTTFHFTIKK